MLIIIAVISAAAAMQAAGGVDYMVLVASKALRARPKALNFVAPYVSYLLTILTGTSNTFFSIIPVINEVAYANKIRPERALAGSTVASALGITSSPVAAAMATMLPLVEVYHYDLVDVLLITIPASIVGIFAMSLVMSRHGKDLEDDAEYQRRLAAGEVAAAGAGRPRSRCMPYAKRSVAIFLAGVAAICVFGFVEDIRPTVAAEGGGVEPMSVTPLIQMIMLTAAALILLLRARQGHATSRRTPIFKSGMVAMIALFGIAWMADTFIANNEDAIVQALGSLAENWPFMIAIAIFLVAGAHDEPVGGDAHHGPARPRARHRRRLHDRDVDSRRRRALPAGQRHADRRRRGRHDGHDDSRQARRRPLLPAAAADLLDRDGARGHGHRLAVLRRPHAGAAGADRRPAREMTVRGAALLGIGAMVGAGIFALLGEAGAVAGVGGLDLVPARGHRGRRCSATTSSSSACATRRRAACSRTCSRASGTGGCVGIAAWLGYIVGDRDRLLDGAPSRSATTRPRCSSATAARSGWDNVFTSALVVAMACVASSGRNWSSTARSR